MQHGVCESCRSRRERCGQHFSRLNAAYAVFFLVLDTVVASDGSCFGLF
jgi:hypothetical protein